MTRRRSPCRAHPARTCGDSSNAHQTDSPHLHSRTADGTTFLFHPALRHKSTARGPNLTARTLLCGTTTEYLSRCHTPRARGCLCIQGCSACWSHAKGASPCGDTHVKAVAVLVMPFSCQGAQSADPGEEQTTGTDFSHRLRCTKRAKTSSTPSHASWQACLKPHTHLTGCPIPGVMPAHVGHRVTHVGTRCPPARRFVPKSAQSR